MHKPSPGLECPWQPLGSPDQDFQVAAQGLQAQPSFSGQNHLREDWTQTLTPGRAQVSAFLVGPCRLWCRALETPLRELPLGEGAASGCSRGRLGCADPSRTLTEEETWTMLPTARRNGWRPASGRCGKGQGREEN